MDAIEPEFRPAPETRLNDRIGKFVIGLDVIRDNPEAAARMLAGVVVVQAVTIYTYEGIEYHGFHPQFAPCPLGRVIPEYRCMVYKDRDVNDKEYYIQEWVPVELANATSCCKQ